MVYKFFIKKTGSGTIPNEKLALKPHKPVMNNSKRRRFCAWFKDNIWVADLVEMGLLFSKSWVVKYLLFMIGVFNKNSQVKPLKKKLKQSLMVLLR